MVLEDEETEVTVETYYDPSLVASTVNAIKHDGSNRSRRSSDKNRDRHNSDKPAQKNKKTKRSAAEQDDALPKEEKMRKPRKRGSRGGRNRNKNNGSNKSNASK